MQSMNTHIGLEPETVAVFVILGVVAFILDMLGNRGDKPISLKKAIAWTVFWIVIGLGFALFLWYHFNAEVASLYLAGYLFEQALSVDNLFVMMAIFAWFHVKGGYCHRVLYWGVLGAVVFRLIFVAVGAKLFSLGPVFELIFAALVALSGVMMLKKHDNEGTGDISKKAVYRFVRHLMPLWPKISSHAFFLSRHEVEKELLKSENRDVKLLRHGAFYATPLFLCMCVIETTDVMFAFDSVPAVIAVSREPLIVYSAMMFAVLGLRSMYFVLDAMRSYLVHLEKAVIALLFFIAFKLLAGASLHLFGFGIDIGVYTSLAVIAVLLSLGILASLVFPGQKKS